MNTQDYKPFDISWSEIFQKQKTLKFAYEPEAKALFENFDLDTYEDQELFKRYCWRITEEFTEAIEASSQDKEHENEELVDALNFTIELLLLYGWNEKSFTDNSEVETFAIPLDSLQRAGIAIYILGLAANCLKNRQWRRSQYLVDLIVFEYRLKCFAAYMYKLLLFTFGSDEEIRKAWSLKYQVNLFRIQTNY